MENLEDEGEEEVKTYMGCLAKLYKSHSLKLGLDRTKLLSDCFENPCDNYKTVHVAGTNGKGSVCFKIYVCLKLRNYKVGLFSSPHIFSLRERIKINDEPISESDLIHFVNKVFKKAKKINVNPTFFEIMTIVAYLYFSFKRVDYAIIETGIGGRLDATNILKKPELIIITSIGYDHLHLLGAELKHICKEKIGIFKKDSRVLIGPTVSIYKDVFTKATQMNCTLKVIPPDPRGESFNEENSRIAIEALNMLNIKVSSDSFLKSIITIKPPLRIQYLAPEQIEHIKNKYTKQSNFNPTNATFTNTDSYPHALILDAGHNETAIDRLCRDINCFHKGKSIRVCVSVTKPRNLSIFQPIIAHFQGVLKDIFYLPSLNERTYDFEEILDMLKNDSQISDELRVLVLSSAEKVVHWITADRKDKSNDANRTDQLYTRGSTIPIIVKNAFLECCNDNSILLICGTFFIFNEVLNAFDIYSDMQDALSMNEPSII
ncbi:dihydrofolate synthase/folylpolyglutamate synthase [Plasmodium gonderi]|uniref:Dihydrofolate synthase/folylpolyglutamate synthase n=1 Tax=Plasmodium gonderi TaxID=77519 RepID=A0A1Y1JLH0_PLAGO|nr:dihydrofolate synthase/folylpolyglutamate synthase [Plasmodium gonderi]GAW82315.1 dihydrofolate synthase/folylpolyglutamate synthase [Plasmodium gonderi]